MIFRRGTVASEIDDATHTARYHWAKHFEMGDHYWTSCAKGNVECERERVRLENGVPRPDYKPVLPGEDPQKPPNSNGNINLEAHVYKFPH